MRLMEWARWKPDASLLGQGDALEGKRLDATCAAAAKPCGLILRKDAAELRECVRAVQEANELAQQAQKRQQQQQQHGAGAGGGRAAVVAAARDEERFSTLMKKSWAVAMAPIQQTLSMGFMLWMSGSGVHIFSMMTTFTCMMIAGQSLLHCLTPFRALEQADARIRPQLWTQKAVSILLALIPVVLAVRKCINMQFLPTTEADFVGLLPLYSYDRTLGTVLR
ncbi:ER membrane protein complex subunit 4 [Porphyridium purpureum]|uniref:ER membrane protein complex subunit 4 n=1 Tax=Porphyridium purpureum TaxID=35688 RepID=A0A5J4YNA6_PORPP|nr:ER membrane protein complex subunit 4 [Porphyridium purpureum]|eukprot:POR7344..scf222_8